MFRTGHVPAAAPSAADSAGPAGRPGNEAPAPSGAVAESQAPTPGRHGWANAYASRKYG